MAVWDAFLRWASGGSRLHSAARSGNREALVQTLNQGLDVNAQDKYGQSPLHVAARKGHVEAVTLLVSRAANLNLEDKRKQTALHVALVAEQYPSAELLIRQGTNLSIWDVEGRSPLHWAVFRGQGKLVELLLDHGAPVGPHGRHPTPLHLAVEHGHLDIVQLLLAHQADPNAACEMYLFLSSTYALVAGNGWGFCSTTPLHVAVWKGSPEIVDWLLQHGADVHAKTGFDPEGLPKAGEDFTKDPRVGDLKKCNLYLRAEAGLGTSGGFAFTAVEFLVLRYLMEKKSDGDEEILRSLMSNGADLTARIMLEGRLPKDMVQRATGRNQQGQAQSPEHRKRQSPTAALVPEKQQTSAAGLSSEQVAAAIKAHWAVLARAWWSRSGKTEAVCDECMEGLRFGEGFLKGGDYLRCEKCTESILETAFDVYAREMATVLGQVMESGQVVTVLAAQGGDIRNFLGG